MTAPATIATSCKICGKPLTVREPAEFADYCRNSMEARNRRIDAEMALRNARRLRHDAPGGVGTNAMGSAVRLNLPPLVRATAEDVRKAWIGTLCHHACYERRDKRLGLESRIAGAMVHRQANPSEWHEGGKLRTALEGICKEWCRCISRDFGHPDGIYWPELVQCLMEYPRERARIMESAVEFLRKQVKGENMNNQLLGEEK